MPTAALLFFALLAIYVAASGRAQKVLQALGAGASTEQTGENPLDNNAATYNFDARLNNPGSLNDSDNPAYQTNYGIDNGIDLTGTSYDGYGNSKGTANNLYLGPPIRDGDKGGSGDTRYLGPPERDGPPDNLGHYTIGGIPGFTSGDWTGWGMGVRPNPLMAATSSNFGGYENPTPTPYGNNIWNPSAFQPGSPQSVYSRYFG